MATSSLIVSRQPGCLTSRSSTQRDLCRRRLPRPCRCVSAFNCAFSFVFFNFQHSNLRTLKLFCPNSFPHNLLADPHTLNPVVSIFYRNSGGRGPFLLTSLPPYLLTSKSERLNHVPQKSSDAVSTTIRSPLPAHQPQRQP